MPPAVKENGASKGGAFSAGVAGISSPVSSKDLEVMLANKALLTFLKSQVDGFWVTFVTYMKEYSSKELSLSVIENMDIIFIDFLKHLVASKKKSSGLLSYLKAYQEIIGCIGYLPNNALFASNRGVPSRDVIKSLVVVFGEQLSEVNASSDESKNQDWMTVYHLHRIIVNAFYGLWSLWNASVDVSNMLKCWQVSRLWSSASACAGPYELFLRARWGEQLLSIVGCTKNEIAWWHSRPATVAKSPKRLHPWLPKFKNPTHSIFCNCLYDVLKLITPPLLAQKFHTGNVHLIADMRRSQCSSTAVAAWFVHYHELSKNFIPLIAKQMEKFIATGSLSLHLTALREFAHMLEEIHSENLIGAPKYPHQLAKTAEEFLLEPSVLIQVPWNHTIREQWLTAALIEIMKLEINCVEFRHWPLECGDLEVCARNLLWIVTRAKELVLSGLQLHLCLARNQSSHNTEDYASVLIDHVVLPLRLLLSPVLLNALRGMAFDLKHALFTTRRSLNDNKRTYVSMNASAYELPENILKCYTKSYWHVAFWMDRGKEAQNFLQSLNIPCKWSTLRRSPPLSRPPPFCLNLIQQEELAIRGVLLNMKSPAELLEAMPLSCVEMLEQLLSDGVFPDDVKADVMLKLLEECKSITSTIELHGYPLSATMFQNLKSVLEKNCPQDDNMLACLIRLSGELLKKEQYVRSAAAVSQLTKLTPVISNLQGDGLPVDFGHHIVYLNVVRGHFGSRDRFKLWQLLDKKWAPDPKFSPFAPNLKTMIKDSGCSTYNESSSAMAKHVTDVLAQIHSTFQVTDKSKKPFELNTEEAVDFSDFDYIPEETKKKVILKAVDSLQSRWGTIVEGLAVNCYTFTKNAPLKMEDKWCEIHYLMPSFLSSIVALVHTPCEYINLNLAQNLIDFYTSLLCRYELMYMCFSSVQAYADFKDPNEPPCPDDYKIALIISQQYSAETLAVLSFHAPYDEGLNSLLESLTSFPFTQIQEKSTMSGLMADLSTYSYIAWEKICYHQTRLLRKSVKEEFKYPKTIPDCLDNRKHMIFCVLHVVLTKLLLYLIIMGRQNSSYLGIIVEYNELFPALQTLNMIDLRRVSNVHCDCILSIWYALKNMRVTTLKKMAIQGELPPYPKILTYDIIDPNILDFTQFYLQGNVKDICRRLDIEKTPTKFTMKMALDTIQVTVSRWQSIVRPKINDADLFIAVNCEHCGLHQSQSLFQLNIVECHGNKNYKVFWTCSEECLDLWQEKYEKQTSKPVVYLTDKQPKNQLKLVICSST